MVSNQEFVVGGHFDLMPLILPAAFLTSMHSEKPHTSDRGLFDEVEMIGKAIGELEATSEEARQQV